MEKHEIENKIKTLEENHARDIAALRAELDKPEGKWAPKPREEYWYFTSGHGSQLAPHVKHWNGDCSDCKGLLDDNIVFRTKEEAEAAIALIKTLEFGPPPFKYGDMVWARNTNSGAYLALGGVFSSVWLNHPEQLHAWRVGRLFATEGEARACTR